MSAIHQSIKIFHRTIVCGLVSVALTGCGKPAEAPVPAPAKSADAPKSSGPAVSVTTVIATQREFAVNLRAVGTVVPLVSVEVKPQLSAVVAKVHVQEGQFVRKGEALFSLDARNDEANVIRLQAQMARNEVALVDAQRQLARSRDLLARKFVAQGATDSSQAAVDSLSAAVAADRAALDAAKVALSYTRVVAPSAGRVGAINVFVGTSVQANQTTLLSITQLDPIEVAFSIPQLHVGDALAALSLAKDTVNVRTDTGEQFSGRVQFVDNAVDMATGTVKVKARLGNRESRLWPGAFVNVEFVASSLKAAVVVPAAAVVQSARGPIVYVVQDGKAVLRKIQLLEVQGEDAAVSGIAAGAKVVLDGKQNVRPDSVVVERTAADSAKPDADAKPGSPSS